MVHSPQTDSLAKTRHVAATATMSLEKQSGIPKRRPIQSTNSESPKWAARIDNLPKLAGTLAINGLATHGRDSPGHTVGAEGKIETRVATPVKPFLGSNITPRSGSRKARAETASPTIHGVRSRTPSLSRPNSSVEKGETHLEDARTTSGLGLRISNTGRRSRTGSMISDDRGSSVSSKFVLMERNSIQTMAKLDTTPKFFHADDVKASIPSRNSSEQSLQQGRVPSNVQAMDENISLPRILSSGNSCTTDEQRPQFFHANDTKESTPVSPRHANGAPHSRPPLQTIYSACVGSSPPRTQSPPKEQILPQKPLTSKPSPRRHTRLVSNGGSEIASPQAISNGVGNLSRRASLTSPKQPFIVSHARSTSVNSSGRSPPCNTDGGLSEVYSLRQTRITSAVGSDDEVPHRVNPPTIPQGVSQPQLFSPPQSPTKAPSAGQSKVDHMNELAANARRERKVLDLEISNSSLLAINRTLEREMRKQAAEIRRFRRFSRSGRLSVAPSRSASGKVPMLSETSKGLMDDCSFSDSSEEDEEPEDVLSNVSSTSAASGCSFPTTHAARDRFKDPRRIELDLAAHRCLLQDSQKLNLSIKHCLSRSESLLESGRRALAYHVGAAESLNLGPRVLTPDEVEDGHFGQGQGLLSPSLSQTMTNPWERSLGSLGSLNADLESPEDTLLRPQAGTNSPTTGLDEENFAEPPDEPTTIEVPDPESTKILQGLDKFLPVPDTSEKYKSLEASKVHLKPGIGERRVSSILSLDGLDDDFDPPPLSRPNSTTSSPCNPSEGAVDPASFVARAERGERIRSPDPKPGEVGFRGSMQGLGHYLQTFSLFGSSQHP